MFAWQHGPSIALRRSQSIRVCTGSRAATRHLCPHAPNEEGDAEKRRLNTSTICQGISRNVVGMPGFEPGTSCTPSRRASQAALHPDWPPYRRACPHLRRDALPRSRFVDPRRRAASGAGVGAGAPLPPPRRGLSDSISRIARKPRRTRSSCRRVSVETAPDDGSSNGSSSSCVPCSSSSRRRAPAIVRPSPKTSCFNRCTRSTSAGR